MGARGEGEATPTSLVIGHAQHLEIPTSTCGKARRIVAGANGIWLPKLGARRREAQHSQTTNIDRSVWALLTGSLGKAMI